MGSYHFEKEGGGEQSYSVICNCPINEMINMLTYAKERSIDLVAVMDAECNVVMITTRQIANLLMPYLNNKNLQPLDALNWIDGKIPNKNED